MVASLSGQHEYLRQILREDINEKKTFSFGHCPNEGGGDLPMPEFLALFQEVHFWSIKRVYFFKNVEQQFVCVEPFEKESKFR